MLTEAVAGTRLGALTALRDCLAEAIDAGPAARDLAALSLRLMDVLAEIEAVQKAAPVQKGTALDELYARRAARVAGSTGRAGA